MCVCVGGGGGVSEGVCCQWVVVGGGSVNEITKYIERASSGYILHVRDEHIYMYT